MIILILVASEINRDVEKLSQEWANIAEKPIGKEVQAFVDELAMNSDCCNSATKTFTRNPLTDESYEKENHTGTKIAGNSSSDDAQIPIVIFMSYSAPKAVWQSLQEEAKILKQPIQFILRGLPGNSFQELARKVMDYGCQVSIDPPLFERYSITAVPAFLVREKGVFVKNNSDKQDHNHNSAPVLTSVPISVPISVKGYKPGQAIIFFGNVSLSYVVENKHKNTTHEIARQEPPQRTSAVDRNPKETRS